mgnify:CR=1 FL=1
MQSGQVGFFSWILHFCSEVKHEMYKVVWPQLLDVAGSTVVVVGLVIIFSCYIGSIDFIYAWCARMLFN